MSEPNAAVDTAAWTLEQRRAFMRLPLAERRRRMAEQAADMAEFYESSEQVAQRATWQGGDIVEP